MTTTYIRYKRDTGQIVQTGTHPNPERLMDELHGVLLGTADDSTHYVKDGKLAELPRQPNPHCVWDGYTWIETRTNEQIQEQLLIEVRAQRDKLLAESDWTQAADAPVDQQAWREYRQALRDLPTAIGNTQQEIEWPQRP